MIRRINLSSFWVLLLNSSVIPYLLASDSITIVTEEWPPYNYLNNKGEIVGTATPVIRKVMDMAEIQYEMKLLSWPNTN